MAANVLPRETAVKMNGKWHYHIGIVETASGSGTEPVIPNIPKLGTIVTFHSVLISGSASTIAPELGRSASWVDDKFDQIIADPSAAASVANTTRTPYYAGGGKLYLRSQPNTGSDNVIHTQIMIISSWE